jgi:hypothetical protein
MIQKIIIFGMGFILGAYTAWSHCPNALRTDPLQVPRFSAPLHPGGATR